MTRIDATPRVFAGLCACFLAAASDRSCRRHIDLQRVSSALCPAG
ncbi:putative leader peptide [Nakamurella flava]|nr:putative leader peptide [Nakamurella flava]